MEEDVDERAEDAYFHSADFELLMLVDAVVAGIDALDEFLDPRRRREFLRSLVLKLENRISPTGDGTTSGTRSLKEATHHTFGSHWARATSELGELARMAFDYPEAVRMYRKTLRVWARSSEQSRLDLVVVLSYVAALADEEHVCLDALELCGRLPGSPTHPTLLQAARRLAVTKFEPKFEIGDTDTVLERLRA